MYGCLSALIQRQETGLWADLFFNGSEGAPCPNWSKRCWHNFQTVLCDSLIWPLLHLPWHPAVLILSAWAFYSFLKPEINFVAEPPNPLSTHIPLSHSSCLGVASPQSQDLESFEMYFLARRALYWILSSNWQQFEEGNTVVKTVI